MGHTYSTMNVNNVINVEEDYSIEDNNLNQDDKKETQEEIERHGDSKRQRFGDTGCFS